jgi:hypothetical protein
MGNLNLAALHHCSSSSLNPGSSINPGSPCSEPHNDPDGYLSDDPAHASTFASRRGERKKGIFICLHFYLFNKYYSALHIIIRLIE